MGIEIYAAGTSPNLPEFWFYNHTVKLVFDQSVWTYYLVCPDGSLEPQWGVTGVLKIIDKSEALMRWAVRTALARTKKLLIDGGYVGEDAKKLFEFVLDDILAQAKKADKEELEGAGEIGHEAHAWIENVIKSVLVGDTDRRLELFAKLPVDDRAANACVAAIEWMVQHNVRWISTERKVFSLLYRYAGTMDGLAWVDSCDDPLCCPTKFKDRKSLIDWKTSNALYITYLMQAACYQSAYQEETGEKIDDRWVIRLGKDDAEFDPWRFGSETFEDDFKGFLNALELYKSVDNIESRMSEYKRGRTAEKRMAKKMKTLAERFWEKVDKNGPIPEHCSELGQCWLWTGATYVKGKDKAHGTMKANVDGVAQTGAHRVAWYLETERWPNPCALHKCDNKLCVRFSHLFEGTVQDNNADMIAKGRFNPGPGKPFEVGHEYYPPKFKS